MDTTYKERGFTLLEFVIVILLIGLLSAVVFPYYIQYQRNANNAVAVNTYLKVAEAYRSVCSGMNNTNAPLPLTQPPTAQQIGLVLNNGAIATPALFAINGVSPSGNYAGSTATATCGNTVALQMTWTGQQFGSNGGAITCTSQTNGVARPADCIRS